MARAISHVLQIRTVTSRNEPMLSWVAAYGVWDGVTGDGWGGVTVETHRGCVVVRAVFDFIRIAALPLPLINVVEVDELWTHRDTTNWTAWVIGGPSRMTPGRGGR